MSSIVRFGSYEVDLSAGQLRKRGVKIHLRDQPFQVLASLLEHPGAVVTREELQRRLWHGDVFVDFENNLNTAVARLRAALCDSSEHPRFIETLPRRGYRFLAAVAEVAPPAEPGRARLLVLPFVNLGSDASQEYFCDAMTDEFITAVANLSPTELAVIARTTSMHYKGSDKNVAQVAREVAVDYVVEGGVRRTNDHVAITIQLVRAVDETHLVAQRFESTLSDIFNLQCSMARAVAAHIPAVSQVVDASVVRKPTSNLSAYNEYIKGRYEMWKWTPESVTKAKQHFEAALHQDPKFALACDGLANLYGYLGFWGFLPPDEAEPVRWFYGLRAHELDPALAEPRTIVAYHPERSHYGGAYTFHWLDTEQQMAQAQAMAPNSSLIRWRHATVLIVLGRLAEAIAELERALEFDPLAAEVYFWMVEALCLDRQYDRALERARRLFELIPEHHVAYMLLGQIYLFRRSFEESISAFRRAVELSGDFPFMLGWLGLALGLGGHVAEARAVLAQLRAISNRQYVLPTSFAWVYLGLGEVDEAFLWMEQASSRHDQWIHPLRLYPFLDGLREDPRFGVLLSKLNLADHQIV